MSFELYVGNYPCTFTSDDLLNLFQDFEDIKIVCSKKMDKKCYSIIRCVDQEQVVDIVTTMHDIDVCGRNLIVRASDKKLQNMILESLRENDILDKHPKNTHHRVVVDRNFHESKSNNTFVEQRNSFFEPPRSFYSPYEHDICSNSSGVGTRFFNPRLNSQSSVKQSDNGEHQKDGGHQSDAQGWKPINQSDSDYKNNQNKLSFPSQGTGIRKFNYDHQNMPAAYNQLNFNGNNPSKLNVPQQDTSFMKNEDHQYELKAYDEPVSDYKNNLSKINYPTRGTGIRKYNDRHQNIEAGDHLNSDYGSKPCQKNFPGQGTDTRKYNNDHRDVADDYDQLKSDHKCNPSRQAFPGRGNHLRQNYDGDQNVAKGYNQSSSDFKNNPSKENFNGQGSRVSSGHQDKAHHYNVTNRNPSNGCYKSNRHDDSKLLNEDLSKNDLFYVSVVNFPLHTSIEDLYILLQDFDPYNIIMICNYPTVDKRPTEAIICFETRNQATDAIINFDNTIYRRRALVVTDTTDISLITDISKLSLGSRDK